MRFTLRSVSAQEIKAELRRLALAHQDILYAGRVLDTIPRAQSAKKKWRRWEMAVIAYARPFKRAKLAVDARWARFSEPDLERNHNELIHLRDRLFAHNDAMWVQRVVVIPPNVVHVDRRINVFDSNQKLVAAKKVVRSQLDRIEPRIAELVSDLTRGQGWATGLPIALDEIDDKLELHPQAPAFIIPKRARDSRA